MRYIIYLLILMLTMGVTDVFAHGTGRYCFNGYCMMCNRLHLIHGHQKRVSNLTYAKYVKLHKELHDTLAPPQFDPTPQVVVDAMLEAVQLTKEDVLCDLGCGDGRIIISAAKKFKCRAIGIELDPRIAKIARQNVIEAGLENRVIVYVGDARKFDLSDATVVTMYLLPDLMEELEPKITHATRIVSYSHEIPNRINIRGMVEGKYPIYLWTDLWDVEPAPSSLPYKTRSSNKKNGNG